MRRGSEKKETVRRRRRGSGGRSHRLLRRAGLPLTLVSVLVATGCATKRDMKDLRAEVIALQARQDSLMRMLMAQNRMILDSLQVNAELVMRVRGELGYQVQQVGEQVLQVQELTGQNDRRLAELRARWEEQSQQFGAGPATAQTPAPTGDGGEAEQLYSLGMEKLEEGATATARTAFEQIVANHSTHDLAPDAQYQIGETYFAERDYESALRELERVLELFPNSPRAAQALYRMGVISEQRGNISRAREYFTRVQAGYPTSEAARLAGDALRRLGGR